MAAVRPSGRRRSILALAGAVLAGSGVLAAAPGAHAQSGASGFTIAAVTLSRASVDVRAATQVLAVRVHVIGGTPVEGSLSWRSPLALPRPQEGEGSDRAPRLSARLVPGARVSGSDADGVYEAALVVPSWAVAGTWVPDGGWIDAGDAGGDGPDPATQPSFVVVNDEHAPSAVRDLHLTSDGQTLSATWTPPADLGGQPLDSYLVTFRQGDRVVESEATEYTHAGLASPELGPAVVEVVARTRSGVSQPVASAPVTFTRSLTAEYPDALQAQEEPSARALSFQLRLSTPPTAAARLRVRTIAGTAKARKDFTPVSKVVTVPAGESRFEVSVPVLDDALAEPTETLALEVTDADPAKPFLGTQVRIPARIFDDEDYLPRLSLSADDVQEGDEGTTPMTFTATLERPTTRDVTVSWATDEASSQAKPGVDYQPAAGTVTIPAGQTSATFDVQVIGDRYLTPDGHRIAVRVSSVSGARFEDPTRAWGEVLDDDPATAPEDPWQRLDFAVVGPPGDAGDLVEGFDVLVRASSTLDESEGLLDVTLTGAGPVQFQQRSSRGYCEGDEEPKPTFKATCTFGGQDGSFLRPESEHVLRISGAPGPVTFTARLRWSDGRGYHDRTITKRFQLLWPAGRACTIRGTEEDDVLVGTSGDDVICGGAGNDVIVGGGGDDVLAGGSGTDTVSYGGAPGRVVVDLGSGKAHGDGDDTLKGVENVVGSSFDDTLQGSPGANQLLGLGGNDVIRGGAGDDVIVGGDGDDRVIGNDGDDAVDAGDGADTVNLLDASGGDSVDGGKGIDVCRADALDALVGCP